MKLMIAEKMNFQLMPERKSTKTPDMPIIIAVPRSGCLAISKTGIIMIKRQVRIVRPLGGSFSLSSNHAVIIGMASFINSDG